MRDDIIQELWRIKDELAREAHYDVHLLCQQLRERQAASRERVVDRSAESAPSATEREQNAAGKLAR
jgi:hypothetical protein